MGAAASSTIVVDSLTALGAFNESHVSAAVVPREGHVALASYLSRLVRIHERPLRATLRFSDEGGGVEGLEAIAERLPSDDALDSLVEDVAFWAEVVADLTGVPNVSVYLGPAACRRDARFCSTVWSLRLVTSYGAPAAEWIEEDERRRRLAGAGVIDSLRDTVGLAPIRRCGPGDVVLLKGDGWPSDVRTRGALHRVPWTSTWAPPPLVLELLPFF